MEWKPIETAPKKEPILTLEENGQMIVGLYDCEMWWEQNMEYALTNPTWWMYLPDRPDLPMGWQPIETAPKGEKVLVYVLLFQTVEKEQGSIFLESYPFGRTATHWQPLPDPPKDDQ